MRNAPGLMIESNGINVDNVSNATLEATKPRLVGIGGRAKSEQRHQLMLGRLVGPKVRCDGERFERPRIRCVALAIRFIGCSQINSSFICASADHLVEYGCSWLVAKGTTSRANTQLHRQGKTDSPGNH